MSYQKKSQPQKGCDQGNYLTSAASSASLSSLTIGPEDAGGGVGGGAGAEVPAPTFPTPTFPTPTFPKPTFPTCLV